MPTGALTGTLIRERRSLQGLRQADLARAAGISASYLNLIEHNRRRVAGEVLLRIALALDVDAEQLTGGAGGALIDGLREAAARAPGTPKPELDRLEEFAGRYPGWAGLIVGQDARILQVERALEALSDRMNHDPHLSASLHELVSAVTSVRSTAAILADTPDIEPDWRDRFQRNLAEDSARLSEGAEALVAYLDRAGSEDTAIAAPQEELEAWLAASGWHLPQAEHGVVARDDAPDLAAAPELASAAARQLALDFLAQYRADAAVLPLADLLADLAAHGPDIGRIAQRFGVAPTAVFRRLAVLPASAGKIGLVTCDGSGTVLFRKPVAGFGLPRFGAACPLWPLYQALSRPGIPLRAIVELPGRPAQRFLTYALCLAASPEGYEHVPVLRSHMLILPAEREDAPAQPVGTSCRICPRRNCAARREPTILRSA